MNPREYNFRVNRDRIFRKYFGFSTSVISRPSKDGDTVNIGSLVPSSGVEFEGGNTNGAGTDLVIGPHSYIDDFEDPLMDIPANCRKLIHIPKNYGKEKSKRKRCTVQKSP